VTLFHEHLSEDLQPLPGAPPKARPSPTRNVDYIVQETNLALKEGVVCLVDGSSDGQLRRMDDLRRIAAATRMHVVVGGGHYHGMRSGTRPGYARTLTAFAPTLASGRGAGRDLADDSAGQPTSFPRVRSEGDVIRHRRSTL
jgi:predicted metal-dependent phosphotriesterase family hydrolase